MELARFIHSHLEEIVAEFESFARSLEPASLGSSVAELRDHARQILTEVADDLVETESPAHKKSKIKGAGDAGRRYENGSERTRWGPAGVRFYLAAAYR